MPPTGGVGRMIASIYAVLGLSPACSLAPSPGDSTVPGAWWFTRACACAVPAGERACHGPRPRRAVHAGRPGRRDLPRGASATPVDVAAWSLTDPRLITHIEKEISELLRSLQPPRVPVECLANTYTKKYGKPLKIEVLGTESQQCDSSLTCLLTMLCTTRVIERHGQCYIVPVEEAPKYLDDDYNLVMTAGGSGANQIYITFGPKSTFTKEDVWNYFSQYGPVNDVQIPLRKKRVFGYVSFLYNGTVKEILSKTMKPHFICGYPVFVKAWKEKHELK
nr:unnamed protein product [Digitaria exilis]